MEDPETEEVDKMEQHFHSKAVVIYETTNIEEIYKEMRDVILEKTVSFEANKSGWQFSRVLYLYINISPYTPIQPSSYIPTQERISPRKAIQNIQNRYDNKCFMWTMGAFYRASLGINVNNPQRLTKELKS